MLTAGHQLGECPRVAAVTQTVADRMQRIDVESGRVGLRVPQRDETAAQLGIVDQIGATEAELDVGDRHRLDLGHVDDVAAELAVQHHHHGATAAGESADEAVADQRQAVVAGELETDAIARPEAHRDLTMDDLTGGTSCRELVQDRIGQLGPTLQRHRCPLIEGAIGERDHCDAHPGIHPHEGTGTPEVSKRGGAAARSGPVRLLAAPDLRAEPPRARVEPADAGDDARQLWELNGRRVGRCRRADQRR